MGDNTLDLGAQDEDTFWEQAHDAIDLASDQNGITWLTLAGRPVAAIVPVDVAEQHMQWLRKVMTGEPEKRPFVAGYDDAINGRPQSVRWGDKLDVARYQAGYGIGKLDAARAAERQA